MSGKASFGGTDVRRTWRTSAANTGSKYKDNEMWLGGTVACFDDVRSCMEIKTRCTIENTRYDQGDFRIGVV